ncbi:MAG: hypothetical protein Q8M92_08480 [Candidatus Subteraquimicrobiales bacterium]|nr:hypothetical protein [Candidatus Subteraquimicrobiales bacterium]
MYNVKPGQSITIDLKTYEANRNSIALPGDGYHADIAFRVISGADRIIIDAEPVVETQAPIILTKTPEIPEVEAAAKEETPNNDTGGGDNPENITTEKDEGEGTFLKTETPNTPDETNKPVYTLEQLQELTNAELNVLLDEHKLGIKKSLSKQVKIDALLRLNG